MLTYKRFDNLEVIGQLDSDFVGSADTRKSMLGYLFISTGGTISWKSTNQFVISASSMKAEFIACFEATIHGLWLQSFILGLGVVDSIVRPLKIYYDKCATAFFSMKHKDSKGAKHIELNYFTVKIEAQKQSMSIDEISTDFMIANPSTKGLLPKTFNEHVERMGIIERRY